MAADVRVPDWLKLVGLTALYAALLSVNYTSATLSATASTPSIQVVGAFIDTLLLSYFVISSRFSGRKEWGALFAILFGMVYVLTAIESVYLGSILAASTIPPILVNGGITSAIYAAALVWAFGGRAREVGGARLKMPARERAWKILVLSGTYLLLFILFGLIVYAPLGKALDPAGYASEQATASSAAALVFPVELLRGALWAILGVPAILALPFDWKKTGLVVGLLMAVPLTMVLFQTNSMSIGLQVAHAAEIFGENLVFGAATVWILKVHHRISSIGGSG
jgi:hypothetical protein